MAGLDPSIALQFRPPRVRSPLETALAGAQLEGAMLGNQQTQMQMRRQEQASADEEASQQALREFYGSDRGAESMRTLAQRSPKAFQGESKRQVDEAKDRAATESSRATAYKNMLDAQLAKIGVVGQTLGGVKDQQTYSMAVQRIGQMFPDVAAQMPQVYNPQEVQLAVSATLKRAEQLADDRGRIEQAERERHNRENENLQRRGQDMAAATARQTNSANRAFAQADKLRDEFQKGSGEFVKVRDAYERIQRSAASPSAAGDLALIFNYMKMLDPGSVVREGEFATAQNAAGVDDRVRNAYNKALNGQRLNPNQRADFISQAGNLYAGALAGQEQLEGQYLDLSTQFGVDPKTVLTDYRIKPRAKGAPGGVPRVSSDAEYNALPSGTTFIDPNGKTRRKP